MPYVEEGDARIDPIDPAFEDPRAMNCVQNWYPNLCNLLGPDCFLTALPSQRASSDHAPIAKHEGCWISGASVGQVGARHSIWKVGVNDFNTVVLQYLRIGV